MIDQNQISDKQIAELFNQVLISRDPKKIYAQRCMISLIASKLSNFNDALPQTAKSIKRDMRGLQDQAVANNESNIICFLVQNSYSATLAYQFVTNTINQPAAAYA